MGGDRFFALNFKSLCRSDLAPYRYHSICIYLAACKAACPYIDLARSYVPRKVREAGPIWCEALSFGFSGCDLRVCDLRRNFGELGVSTSEWFFSHVYQFFIIKNQTYLFDVLHSYGNPPTTSGAQRRQRSPDHRFVWGGRLGLGSFTGTCSHR